MKIICKSCNIEKEISEFSPAQLKQGSRCRECIKVYNKQYNLKNKEKIAEKQKEYYKNNKDFIAHRMQQTNYKSRQ